jgi:SAM-dependent methyltransferase
MPGSDPRFTQQWDAVDPFDPEYPHLWIKVEHLGRYLFAARYLSAAGASRIADIGAGTGYGSAELAGIAETVIGVDSVLNEAQRTNAARLPTVLSFEQVTVGDGRLSDRFGSCSFDAVVTFETLEHLIDPGEALRELHSISRPGGTLLLSVPNSVAERTQGTGVMSNPHHRRMFSISSICELTASAGWTVKELLGQPLASEINRNETRLIRRRQTDGRIGDEPAFHSSETIRRLALSIGYPEPRDIERSYSIILIAERNDES